MSFAQKKSALPAAEERRRFQRVKVHLLGRYMLPDRREFPCQIINMSPGGLALLAPGIGNVGDRVIAYLDHIGRVEGRITRIIDNGFAMTVGATARKRDKLAAQLTWLANRDILNLPEDRRHDRIVPRNPIAVLTLEDGSKHDLPDHRPVAVGRRGRRGKSPAAEIHGSAGQRAGAGGAQPRGRFCARVRPRAGSPRRSKRALPCGKALRAAKPLIQGFQAVSASPDTAFCVSGAAASRLMPRLSRAISARPAGVWPVNA